MTNSVAQLNVMVQSAFSGAALKDVFEWKLGEMPDKKVLTMTVMPKFQHLVRQKWSVSCDWQTTVAVEHSNLDTAKEAKRAYQRAKQESPSSFLAIIARDNLHHVGTRQVRRTIWKRVGACTFPNFVEFQGPRRLEIPTR